MSHGERSISIVIPAYNEARRIERTLKALLSYINDRDDVEIIIVMDGCTDETPNIVMRFARSDPRVIPLVFGKRLGKGGALLKGFEVARGNVLILCDADMPTNPEELMRLANMIDDHDMVIGSRYVKGAKLIKRPTLMRFFLSRAFNVLVRLLFPSLKDFRDTQCGLKAVRKGLIEIIKDSLVITNFAFDVNLLYSAVKAGANIKELGVYWRHVELGSILSSELVKAIVEMWLSLLKLRIYTISHYNTMRGRRRLR